jgi:hypothetical protein
VSAEEAGDGDVQAALANTKTEELLHITSGPPSSPWTIRKGMINWMKRPSESGVPPSVVSAQPGEVASRGQGGPVLELCSVDVRGVSNK